MGKVNIFTLLTTVVMQFVVGYLWYGTYLFGGVVGGEHGIDFLKLDVITLLLLIFSSYGLTSVFEKMKVKDVGGALRTGLTIGVFAIGLPIVMLLNLMGTGHIALLVIFTHLVIISILTSMIVLKLGKS